jgi:hypothetical protein
MTGSVATRQGSLLFFGLHVSFVVSQGQNKTASP